MLVVVIAPLLKTVAPPGVDPMFIGDVVIVAHDAVMLQVIVEEEVVLLASHAIVHQVFVHP